MPESTTPVIPQEWITIKTLKTISGASLCCWLTTVFFDLVCFVPVKDLALRAVLVLIVSTVSCLSLAAYKVFTTRGKKTSAMWVLIIPNATLIYIHALGFQVATKELAARAYESRLSKEKDTVSSVQINNADMGAFFFALSKQTSWIPSLDLLVQAKRYEQEDAWLKRENQMLKDSLNNLSVKTHMEDLVGDNEQGADLDKRESNVSEDSLVYLRTLNKKYLREKHKTDSVNEYLMKRIAQYELSMQSYTGIGRRDSILVESVREKNRLINKWNQLLQPMVMQRADQERIMNGYMGDESYYKKLFRPIVVE